MAQSDYELAAHVSGLNQRTEINSIFDSILTHNSGSTAPTVTKAFMMWVDTSNATYYYLKMRNHDNTAWVTLGIYTVATKAYTSYAEGTVKLTENQIIDGVKTFSSSPIVPTPTTGTQAVNKEYVDSKQTLPIGAILNGFIIFDNCIVAFGGEFNRADYPKLWAYLQANPSLVKTQTQWQTEATANGGICGFFSDGNGTTTFRVPNLDKAFLRPDSRVVGSFEGDAIRNITGTFRVKPAGGVQPTGAFETDSMGGGSSANDNTGPLDLRFNASKVVPTSTENRPKNIAVLPLIVAK